MEKVIEINNWVFFVVPEIMALYFYWIAIREYKKVKRKYGKKYATAFDIFSHNSLGMDLFLAIAISIIVLISVLKLGDLCKYSQKAYLILVPISTLTIAYITIVYSSQRDKYVFFSDTDIIKGKQADFYVKGIVLTLFLNIFLSAVIVLGFFENKLLIVVLVLFNVICAGICIFFCAYVCWAVSSTVFSSDGGKKLLNRLSLIFDMYAVDMSFADKISCDIDARRIANIIYYLSENYISCYDDINGDNISEISIVTRMENLPNRFLKKWKIRNVKKIGVLYFGFVLLVWIAFWTNGFRYRIHFLVLKTIILIFIVAFSYRSKELQATFSGSFGYVFNYKDKTKGKIMGYGEPFYLNVRLNKFMMARNSLLAGCLILANRIDDKEKLIKIFDSGINLALEHGKENLNIKMYPFIMLNKMYKESHDQKDLFDVKDNEWFIMNEKEKANMASEETVLLRNIGNPYTELIKL